MPADAAATPLSGVSTLERRIEELSAELRARTAERDEAMQREGALAEVLQVINSSSGDLAPVFNAMLEKATQLCGAEFGCLFLYDGQAFTVVADRNLPSAYAQKVRGQPFSADGNSVLRNMLENKVPVHVTNMFDAAYSSREPLRILTVELGGVRSMVTVPLVKKTQLIGFFSIYKSEAGGFAGNQIALVSTFANQAVIAIENTRLITQIREALEQQTAAAEMLGIINSSPGDLAPVIDIMLEKATRLCQAPYGVLWIYDGHSFRGAATRGLPSELVAQMHEPQVPAEGSGIGRLLAGERYAHWEDLKEADAYNSVSPIARAVVDHAGGRSNLMVPLRSDAAFLGAISVFRKEVRPFSDKEIALLQNFAAQAVIAMENARLLGELRERTNQVAELNRGLEARVAEQVEELGRVGRLKRFLAPQLAELIVSQGDEKILESHRREIVVVFCDLRGYTAFAETAEPEEVLDFLREYHGALGPLVSQFEGTVDQFSGDGIMVFFNDPVPIPDPAERAVKMAVAMREAASSLIAAWRERGRELGFGAGIAQGYATLGQIGFSERSGYTAIGTVCNVAARLCGEAKDGHILLSQRVNVALKGRIATEQFGSFVLKGFTQPIVAYNVPLPAL